MSSKTFYELFIKRIVAGWSSQFQNIKEFPLVFHYKCRIGFCGLMRTKSETSKLARLRCASAEMNWLQLASIIELKIVCFLHLFGADSGRPTWVPELWKDDVSCDITLPLTHLPPVTVPSCARAILSIPLCVRTGVVSPA